MSGERRKMPLGVLVIMLAIVDSSVILKYGHQTIQNLLHDLRRRFFHELGFTCSPIQTFQLMHMH